MQANRSLQPAMPLHAPLTWAELFARVFPFALGFLLVANLFLLPSRDASPRATDLVGMLLVPWLLVRAHRPGLPKGPLAALAAVGVLPLAWAGLAYLQRDMQTLVQAMRWLLAIPWGMTLVLLFQDEHQRDRFVRGLLWGCAANVAVVVLQAAGLDVVLQPLGMAATDTDAQKWVGGQARLSGLHRHYGASSAVTSLIIPAALYLYLKGRHGVWLPFLALAGLAVTLHLTSTRSPLVVAALTVGVALVASRRPRAAFTLGVVLGGIVLPALLIFGPPGGSVRWKDSLSFEANATERLHTNVAALDLIVQKPQGWGVTKGKREMAFAVGIDATHNAYLQSGLYFGAPLGIAVFVGFLVLIWGLISGRRGVAFWAGLVALHVFGLFFFEEHLNNATFVILAAWLVAQSVAPREESPHPERWMP